MVMGGDSCLEGRGFKSQHRILDQYFFTYTYLFEKTKINEKEAGDGPFKTVLILLCLSF